MAERSVRLHAPARELAQLIVSALEGAMLVARPYGELDRFKSAVTGLFSSLAASAAPVRGRRASGPPR